MKKIFRLIAALAATTVAFSCMEEANPETPETGKTNYDGPVTTLEFTLDELETKTAWDGENHTWSDGDMIKIIWMDAEGKTGDVPAEVVEGKVTATVGVADTYYAVYPETTAYTLAVAEGQTEPQFSVTIPKIQDGSFSQANIMAAKTAASEKVLAFKNLTHIFKFELSEGCEYNFFRFCTNSTRNQESRYAGTPSLITFGDDDVTVGAPATGTGNTSYVCVKLDEGAKGPFYLGVRAGAVTDKGFGVLASKARKEGDFTGGLLTTTAVETTRSKITNLGILDDYISDDWYITEKGTGSGKSWADPAGIGLLIDLMKNRTSDGETYVGNGTTDIYRLIDARIHVAAGTYNIYKANGEANMDVAGLAFDASDRYKSTKITIIGGYPAVPAEGDVPTIGENGSATVFTTNLEQNNRAFNFDGSTIGHLVFEGISFKTADVCAVGNVNFTNNVKGTATFNNCFFSIQSTLTNDGAAVRVTAGGNCDLTFNDCSFIGNTIENGKGAAFYKNNANANVIFNECKFSKNTTSTYGGAIYLDAAKNVQFSSCIFTENNSKYGAAINNTKGIVIVDNCLFQNNGSTATGSQGGGIFTTDNSEDSALSYVYIYNSTFLNNSVANQGGAIRTNGSGHIAVVNSTFGGNTAGSDGSIRIRNGVKDTKFNAYFINSTLTETKNSLYNQSSNVTIYNSVVNTYTENAGNGTLASNYHNCIVANKLYKGTDITETQITFGELNNGIYQLSGATLADGMSSEDLAALGAKESPLMTAMPLFDVSKLTVDQKGNSREGKTIMGAYVGE